MPKSTKGKNKRKPKQKKVLKLITKPILTEDQEWRNSQIKKLKHEKVLVITFHEGVNYTAWNNCSREDIIYMMECLKTELMIERL